LLQTHAQSSDFRPYVNRAMYMVGADGDGVVQVTMTAYTLVEADRHERRKWGRDLVLPEY